MDRVHEFDLRHCKFCSRIHDIAFGQWMMQRLYHGNLATETGEAISLN